MNAAKLTRWGAIALAGLALTVAPAMVRADPPQLSTAVINAYYSPRLQAQFVIQPVYLPYFGTFPAARIVSVPMTTSPLNELGLTLGDVITRLDGIPVTSYAELENHVDWTYVRYIRQGTTVVQTGQMYISWVPGGGPAFPPNLPPPLTPTPP